jgi:arylsulfatase A-like enzyme
MHDSNRGHLRRLHRVTFLTVSLLVVANCLAVEPGQSEQPGYNVILVTPDMLAADFAHTYGYPFPDTPNIDEFASQGTLFLHAYGAGPWTTPSFGAIFTGLFPTVHGMTLPPFQGCGPSINQPMVAGGLPTLPDVVNLSPLKPVIPEVLKAHGLTTAADDGNCWSFFDIVNRGWDSFGFFAGWQLMLPGHPDYTDPVYDTVPNTLSWANQWLSENRNKRFFLWVHFMAPHAPFNPPHEYIRFGNPDDYPESYQDSKEAIRQLDTAAELGDAHAIRREEQLYAAKILYVDHYIGELFKTLRSLGLDERTYVILTSDHGDLVYSHPDDFNTLDHISFYDADSHIPLIVRGPGVARGVRAEAIVSHYDLFPTILDLLGLPQIEHHDGTSLKPLLSGDPSRKVHDYVYGEQTDVEPEFGIRDTRYKLIENFRTGEARCFDSFSDPGEKRNICADVPEVAARLKSALDEHIQSMIREAKTYPDWQNNLALAVLEQRDSAGLKLLAPADEIFGPVAGMSCFQLNGPGRWRVSTDKEHCEGGLCYWTPAGTGSASARWRSETPLTGLYDVFYKYGAAGAPAGKLATNASLTVVFGSGSLAVPIDQNQRQGEWIRLGRFNHPQFVRLTNLADGPVVAGSVRFLRVDKDNDK